MPVKVTHVVRQYLPSIGGMEEVVRNIAQHQQRMGNQSVKIITLDRLFRNTSEILPAREIIDGIEVIRLPYVGSSRYPICVEILNKVGDADVIHVHGVDFFYDFLAATKWIHKRALMLSTHGGFFHTSFASRAKLAYFNTVTRFSGLAYQKVIATSANDSDLFSNIIGKAKLETIENGVDVEKYAQQAAPTLQPTLIYFGRWSANKGLLQAIDKFAMLKSRDSQWRLIIAGREYDHSCAELQAKVDSLGLTQAVELVANPSGETIRQLINKASYFLCLSRHEGFGIAPIEGMSAGLTPILSDIPPFRRLIESSELGFLLHDINSSEAAVDQLLALHQEGDSAYQQRRTKAMTFASRYAWPQVADRYLALYQQLGGQKK